MEVRGAGVGSDPARGRSGRRRRRSGVQQSELATVRARVSQRRILRAHRCDAGPAAEREVVVPERWDLVGRGMRSLLEPPHSRIEGILPGAAHRLGELEEAPARAALGARGSIGASNTKLSHSAVRLRLTQRLDAATPRRTRRSDSTLRLRFEPQRARDREHLDLARPRGEQGLRRRAGGRAGGEHVVDEQQRAPLDADRANASATFSSRSSSERPTWRFVSSRRSSAPVAYFRPEAFASARPSSSAWSYFRSRYRPRWSGIATTSSGAEWRNASDARATSLPSGAASSGWSSYLYW